MAKVIVQHHVSDYDRWIAVFNEHQATRQSHGATGHSVNRAAADPNTIVIVNDFATLEGAQAFSRIRRSPRRWRRAGWTARRRSGSWTRPTPRPTEIAGQPRLERRASPASDVSSAACPTPLAPVRSHPARPRPLPCRKPGPTG